MDLPDIHAKKSHYGHHLTRVGIKRVKKPVQVTRPNQTVTLNLDMDIYVDLPAEMKGSHMSRNAEVVDEIIEISIHEPIDSIENLALHICRVLLERHPYATYDETQINSDYFIEKTIESGKRSTENYLIFARGQRWKDGRAKKSIGTEVLGISACPCAMEAVRTLFEKEKEGLDKFKEIPMITHNQRNRVKVLMEVPGDQEVEVNDLINILEDSVSAPTFSILKRTDEANLVVQAHKNPKFVEDVVRDALKRIHNAYQDLPDETAISITSESEESIHKHNAYAERTTTLGELKQEIVVWKEKKDTS